MIIVDNKKSELSPLSYTDYTKRTGRLIEKIQSFSVTKELYEQAEATASVFHKSGPWTICFVRVHKDSPAFFDPEKRMIYLDPSLSEEENLNHLIFELINIKFFPRFAACNSAAHLGTMEREEYAKGIERVEFDTYRIYYEVAKQAIQKMKWALPLNLDIPSPTSFESYWEIQKSTPHCELYRKQWDDIRKFQMQDHEDLNRKLKTNLQINEPPQVSKKLIEGRFEITDVEEETDSEDSSPVPTSASPSSAKYFEIMDIEEETDTEELSQVSSSSSISPASSPQTPNSPE